MRIDRRVKMKREKKDMKEKKERMIDIKVSSWREETECC